MRDEGDEREEKKLTSMVPAMSMCAQRIVASSLSMPSTKLLKNSAAVQDPASLPPV